jgi:DNA (cytosine-5)-methyltransferase 1
MQLPLDTHLGGDVICGLDANYGKGPGARGAAERPVVLHPIAHAADLETYIPVASGGNNTAGPIDVATAVNAHGGPHGRLDFESETFVTEMYSIMPQNSGRDYKARLALRADGFDASEDGTGRGTPLVATFLHVNKGRPAGRKSAHTAMVTLETEAVPTLTTDGHAQSAVAFAQNQRDEVRMMNVAGALASEPGMKQQTYVSTSAVRRLTPRECCRLQGFPDDYLDITYRGKPAADGNKYRALGNSMAVPVMAWIGRRIQMMEGTKE